MLIQSATLYLHGAKLALIPLCREINKPFSVLESVQLFSANVGLATLGEAIVASLAGGRDDVESNAEGLGLDEFAKLFGERTVGGFEKRSGRVAIDIHEGQYQVYPWLINRGNGGSAGGQRLLLPLAISPLELAQACREQLQVSLDHAKNQST